MARDTGFPTTDAQFDFGRARRSRALARLGGLLRGEPGDLSVILPFEEVVSALGRRGERRLGLQTIELDSIVGTVDREREFDRNFRPTSGKLRARWERVAEAMRRGQELPPIDVYRVGGLHFVRDGHHRVSVARTLGLEVIDAFVTEVITEAKPEDKMRLSELPLKSHERLFYERVPLPREARLRVQPSNRSAYASLAEGIEAWGFRVMQATEEFMSREEVAGRWFRDEYVPVVDALREAGLATEQNETDAYMAVVSLRYLLLRTHEWDEEVVEALVAEMRNPSWQNTEIKRLRKTLR